ncbi:GntR family transcriptional regulator [Knoellia locipacati]|uniref:GntR family transcriptional regulator n=1 Tax=Knoellia locipacati TaxID=882824 RepID=UPI00384E1670
MNARQGERPMHAVVRAELHQSIREGRFRPGDQVPTEPQLMERFGVSRTTVRRALRDLETQGLIVRQPGRGSFVAQPQVEPRLDRLTGFVEDMEALGLHASASVELIETVPAPERAADALRCEPGESVVHIERVRLANETPLSFDDSYFVADLGQRVARENLRDEPFYSILEEKYGVALAGADYVVRATVADERVADHLQIAPGDPVLLMERTSCIRPDRAPVLFEYLHFAAARVSYRLSLDR